MKGSTGLRGAVVSLAAVLTVSLMTSSAMGSGFALIEQGVKGLGNAYAGGAASAEDASTIFFNPAGMTRLSGSELIVAGHIVMPSAKFHNEDSTYVLQPRTGIPLLGGNSSDAGVARVVPNFYYSRKVSDRLAFGIGVGAPFGLKTEYNRDWVGRYYAVNSELITVNINPSVGYKITDKLSAGAGINLMYAKAKLSNAIDFGTLDAVGAFRSLGLPAGSLGLTPQRSDGFADLEGDDWAWGINLGLLYQMTKGTRMGVTYRSRVRQKLEGDVDFSSVPAGLAPFPLFKDGGVNANLTLPETLSVSFFHEFSPEWMIMADVTWTNWSVFDELRVKFDNPDPDSVATTKWEDSYRYSFGVTYKPAPWTFRAGVAYDETPIPNAQRRTPRIPDSHRLWTAFGLGYRISQMFSVDLGYAHIFVDDPQIMKTPTGEDQFRGGLRGTYDAHVDIVSAQVQMNF